jgi:hypothetical protein
MENAFKYQEPIVDPETFQHVEFTSHENTRKIASRVFNGYFFKLDLIVSEPGYNARFLSEARTAHVRWIADQIRDHGFDQTKPLSGFVKDGKLILTDGHCRYEATLLAISEGAEIDELPCLKEDSSFTDEDRALALYRRNEGKKLEPIEVATVVIKRLHKLNWDDLRIANELSKSITWVKDMLILAGAPTQVRELIVSGKIAANLAIDTLKSEGSNAALKTLNAAVDNAGERGKTRATSKNVRMVSLQKGSASTDWKKYGPKLQKALQAICSAENLEAREYLIGQAGPLLREI